MSSRKLHCRILQLRLTYKVKDHLLRNNLIYTNTFFSYYSNMLYLKVIAKIKAPLSTK